MSNDDHSIVDFVLTPHTTATDETKDQEQPTNNVRLNPIFPRPGVIYIIRDADTHCSISFFNGRICLLLSHTLGASIHWKCYEYRGWLGFKNLASGQFLGYDPDDSLRTMPHHLGCESFCVRMVSKGFVFLMMENAELMPIKCKNIDDGVQMLEKVRAPASEGLAWEFEEIKSI